MVFCPLHFEDGIVPDAPPHLGAHKSAPCVSERNTADGCIAVPSVLLLLVRLLMGEQGVGERDAPEGVSEANSQAAPEADRGMSCASGNEILVLP